MGVYMPPGTSRWWISYSYKGTQHRESSGTSNHVQAERLLQKRKDEIFAKRLEEPSPIAKA